MDAKELRQKTRQELQSLVHELRAKVRESEFSVANHQMKKVRDLREQKRDLARVLSVLAETSKQTS